MCACFLGLVGVRATVRSLQLYVKCDTSVGSPLRHAFSACENHIVCVCVVCLLGVGGGRASIFTRASAAAVHWHAAGSVTVVIRGVRQ